MNSTKTYLLIIMLLPFLGYAQKKKDVTEYPLKSETFSGLAFRNIGPAFASGRIADFAVNPKNHSEYYVGVACGNVWKTVNNGTTFKPVFETYGSYSIGALAINPKNPNVVWIGTGENNHQRALAYGDGIYKSVDGGKNWTNMGLKESRHIGMIAIDKNNTDIVFVAAEGSAWGSGGDRGLYKTIDSGKNWKKVLEISENTGINNVIIDPNCSKNMYATSEQRRRHVHTKIGGGPESAIYKSTDNGENWRKLEKGLPTEHMGGIGIAISPVDTDIVYAIIEAANNGGGFYKSVDRGESWTKMNDYSTSGQYYNEIYCDPIDVDKVYSMDTYSKVTVDAGKTWKNLGLNNRHVDDHALWIDPNNTDHFMIGGDGGMYVTYDGGDKYNFVGNLPVTQFYRVGVDNSEPFYWVYGGTQDNNSMGGPSQNLSRDGVIGEEWVVTLGGDGFWNRIDPKNPDIVYSEYQYGNVYRYDKKSGERMYIKPFPGKNELTYRWNWNAPMIISPHSNTRLYLAANKLFRSDDRGNSWKTISDDLTSQISRDTWKVMGKFWSSDAVAKDVSISQFNTIVSFDESPVKENLLFVGTDDGVIQITENAGETWVKTTSFPGIPEYTYVSDIFASRFDENVIYASFDNRKRDDFKPYLLKSTDKGKSWISINKGLPKNGTVHAIEQDFINKDLLFAGTEFGIFFSIDGGNNWIQLKEGIPTIAVRDIAIQQRENDLVLATFGRGFYILDNYSPLRDINTQNINEKAKLFPVKDALMYVQKGAKYGQGDSKYLAKNNDFGAHFSYFLKDIPKTQKQIRHEKEKELFKKSAKIPQISWENARKENIEIEPYLLFTIKDANGKIVRKLTAKPKKGINRITWNLRKESTTVVHLKDDKFDPFKKQGSGFFVSEGKYSVTLGQVVNNVYSELNSPVDFNVKALQNTTLPSPNRKEMDQFLTKVNELEIVVDGAESHIKELIKKMAKIKQAILITPNLPYSMMEQVEKIEKELDELDFALNGFKAKASYEEIPPSKFPIAYRMYTIKEPNGESTSAVTKTQKDSYKIVVDEIKVVLLKLSTIENTNIKDIESALDKAGAPYTPGRIPELK